jgi:hypothetical protein
MPSVSPTARAERTPMAKQWSINGRFLSQNVMGVQRYAHEVLRALDELLSDGDELARDLELELLIPAGGFEPPPLRAIRSRIVAGRASGHAWEQLALPVHVRDGFSACATPARLPCASTSPAFTTPTRLSILPAIRCLFARSIV